MIQTDANCVFPFPPFGFAEKSPAQSKSPKTSPKPGKQASPKASQQSPKQRKVKRSAGDD